MLTAVSQDRLTLDRLIDLMHHNPRRIFNLPQQPHTRVEVDMTPHTIRSADTKSKCGWTPFEGMEAAGKVTRVVLRGEVVFEDGRVLAEEGNGRVI